MQTPRKNFEIDVRPACEAYFNDGCSIWKAKAAVQSVNNFAEWTFQYYKKNDPAQLAGTNSVWEFKAHHAKLCQQFQSVWDLADAAKHRTLTKRTEFRTVTSSTGAWARTENTLLLVRTREEVDVLIGAAMAYWDKQI